MWYGTELGLQTCNVIKNHNFTIVMKYSCAAEKFLFSREHKETYLFGMELNECNIITMMQLIAIRCFDYSVQPYT